MLIHLLPLSGPSMRAVKRWSVWGSKAIQVTEEDYCCLFQVYTYFLVLWQLQVTQETLSWAYLEASKNDPFTNFT